MRRVAVLQPSYLPWLGYLDQIAQCDAFVFYDDVQYDKNGWRNRNRIRTSAKDGWSWLTVPVRIDEHFPPINAVVADARVPWRRKHRRAIEMEYARAPYHAYIDSYFAGIFDSTDDNLANIAIASIRALMGAFGITTPLYRSSELGVTGDRNTRLLAICRELTATNYLSGAAAKVYLDEGLFADAGIAVEWQEYTHPTYRQLHEPFIPYLSALDAVLNLGPAAGGLVHREAQ